MKSIKTLIISAAVCGAMALPLSSLAGNCSGGHGNGASGDDLNDAITIVMKACQDPIKNDVKKKCIMLERILNHHGGKD